MTRRVYVHEVTNLSLKLCSNTHRSLCFEDEQWVINAFLPYNNHSPRSTNQFFTGPFTIVSPPETFNKVKIHHLGFSFLQEHHICVTSINHLPQSSSLNGAP